MATERVDIPQDNTYQMKHPVEVKGFDPCTMVQIRRPKARDLKDLPIEGMVMGDMLKLVAKLANLPMPVLDEMDVEDFQALSGMISGFLNNGQRTGEKAS